jgi:hypothetical protein
VTKIDEVTDRSSGNSHIVEELRFVLCCEFGYGFELHDQAPENVKVRDVAFLQLSPFIMTAQPRL